MNIVLVEDNTTLNFAMTLLLRKNDFRVHTFQRGDELIDRLPEGRIDLFILDINLPDMDGFELLEILRPYFESSDFIFISSYTDMARINRAFSLGCEDYVKKPFEVEELLLRVRKVQARRSVFGGIDLGEGCRFNIEDRTLESHDGVVVLTEKESRLLQLLARNRGRLVTYETIGDHIWGESVPQNTIAAVVKRLRGKIRSRSLQTVRERGYRLLE